VNEVDNQLSDKTAEAIISEERPRTDAATDIIPVPDAFHIDSACTANWFVRKMLERRRYRDQVKAWADAEIRRAEREEGHLLQRYGAQLEAWLKRALDERGGRRRSISLPAGLVGLRAEPARLVVSDQEALIEWCRSHLPEAVQVRIEAVGGEALQMETWVKAHCVDARQCVAVGKATVNNYFADCGELPPGTEVVPRQDVLTVK
jgi:hypothetical protein